MCVCLCVLVCGTVKKVCVCVFSIHKIAVLIKWDKIPIFKQNGEEILFLSNSSKDRKGALSSSAGEQHGVAGQPQEDSQSSQSSKSAHPEDTQVVPLVDGGGVSTRGRDPLPSHPVSMATPDGGGGAADPPGRRP